MDTLDKDKLDDNKEFIEHVYFTWDLLINFRM
jgi:hypothetical protein